MADLPPLRKLHKDSSLLKSTLDHWRKKATAEILNSLREGAREPLLVKADGTVMNGHHRLKVLEERGIDTDSLPRISYEDWLSR